MIVTAGKTNVSIYYYIVGDASHASPGDPITGLLFSDIETGGSASYNRQGAARVDLTLITLASASAAHSDGGFILVDDTNMPGVYRCDYPDAAFATGVDQTICSLVVASANNAAVAPILVDIADFDLRTASPVVASVTAGVTLAAGAITDTSLAGNMELVFETDFATNYNTTRNAWTTNTQDLVGTGAWNTGKTGYALTTADWNVGKTGYSLTATTGLGAQTANITGNLSGSVGSVTGAVGSVTGHTNQTGDSYAIVNGAAGLVAINADVETILGRIIGTLAAGAHNPATAAQIAVLSDWINGGRLDLLLDAIKAKTDSLTFTKTNEVDANAQSINGAAVVGDGNATPWDGA